MVTAVTTPEEEKQISERATARRVQFAMAISNVVKWASPLFMITVIGLWLVIRQYPQLLAMAALLLFPTVGAWLYPTLHQKDQTRMGTVILLVSVLLDIALGFPLLPEVALSYTIVYILIIVLTCLLLDSQDGKWVIGACILAFGIDIVLMYAWTPTWYRPMTKAATLIIAAGIDIPAFFTVALVIRNIMAEQEGHFFQFHQANLEIERYAAAEKEQRQYLEDRVEEYVRYMEQVRQGNLSARLSIDGGTHGNPLIDLGHSLNETVADLQRMITQIGEAASNLSAATAEIVAAAAQQASGASEQSAAISQTTTTVEEVKTISEQSTQRAQEVVDFSQRTVEVSHSGQQSVQETIQSMAQIKSRVESIAENIVSLSEQTQQIGSIISTVNDISAQSNMLALNASVEAARAGEHGKGFAVVAVEVRNLAEQSRQATAQVKAILSNIQNGINATVMTTEEGTKVVEQGVELAAQAQSAIEQLASVINESSQLAMQMMAGGRQQASGIEQIALAMQNINQATMQNLSSTRQTEKAVQDLNDLARDLTDTVKQYQL